VKLAKHLERLGRALRSPAVVAAPTLEPVRVSWSARLDGPTAPDEPATNAGARLP
jgi:hypothetical protein